MSDLFALSITASGAVTCDGERCDETCPVCEKK